MARAREGVILGVKRKLPAADTRCPGCLEETVPESTRYREPSGLAITQAKKRRCRLHVLSASWYCLAQHWGVGTVAKVSVQAGPRPRRAWFTSLNELVPDSVSDGDSGKCLRHTHLFSLTPPCGPESPSRCVHICCEYLGSRVRLLKACYSQEVICIWRGQRKRRKEEKKPHSSPRENFQLSSSRWEKVDMGKTPAIYVCRRRR